MPITTLHNTSIDIFDDYPTEGSSHLVSSGAVWEALQNVTIEDVLTKTEANELFLRLTGGTVTGNVTITGDLIGDKVYGAVWNDYAEARATEEVEPGRVVIEDTDGIMKLSTERLQPTGSIVSDTYGMLIGQTGNANTPIAISGRALVYTYENRDSYILGDCVCTGPDGTVSKMTREEIKEYPDRIIGVVSEIPQYKTWGTNNIKVNNRIWIRIK